MVELIPIYSIAKPFLAESVIALEIPLDSQIGEYVPGLQDCFKSRRIKDLLNHTSGLDDYGAMPEYQLAVEEGQQAWDRDTLLAVASRLSHRNTGFCYSNIGYLLLVMLVERETKLTYFEAISSLVLNPLGISGFAPWLSRHSSIPSYDQGWVYSGTFLGDPMTVASSLMKLARYRHETIGLRAGIIHLSYPDTGFERPGYGYGLMTDGGGSDLEPRYVGHGGGGPGFNLMALVNTSNWKSEFRYSTGVFNQRDAIAEIIRATGP